MAELCFQDFRFEEKGPAIRFHFLKLYFFDVPKEELARLGETKVEAESLSFPEATQDAAERLFYRVIQRGFERLTNKLTGNPTRYLHRNSGIPLMGALSFGIVDKGSDMMELKPLTSCNADCLFCSVDEGPSSKKRIDIVVEKDYLVQETRKLLEFKQSPVHIYLNPHGEPTLYADLVELVRDLSKTPFVASVHLITNMTLVSKELADKLIDAGLTSFNVSFHALNPENAKKFFHMQGYNVKKVLETLAYAKGRVKILLAPVYLPGLNEQDVEDIVKYAKEQDYELFIQNFLENKRGRNPVKEMPFDTFSIFLKGLEAKYGVELLKRGKVGTSKEYPKPFVEGDMIEVEI
ncbi:MAG: radical SAM protein, partial [Nanoarchaeota archaeon]|nr:radical SAM protein [Nanoarchaeota archaeon]